MSQDTDHGTPRDLSGAFGRPLTSSLRGLLPPRAATVRADEVTPDAELDADVDDRPDDDVEDDEPEDDADEFEDEFEDDEPDDELDEDIDEELDEDTDGELDEPDDEHAPGGAPAARVEPSRGSGARAPRRSSAARAPRAGPVSPSRAAERPAPTRGSAPPPREAARSTPAPTAGRAARPSAAATGATPSSPGSGSANRRWGIARIASRDHIDLLVLLALEQGAGSGRDVIARLRADSGDLLDAPEQTVHRTLHRLARNRLVVRRTDGSRRITYSLSDTGRRSMHARVREWRALSRAFGAVLSERSL